MKLRKKVPQKNKKASGKKYSWKSLIPFGIVAAIMVAIPAYLTTHILNNEGNAAIAKSKKMADTSVCNATFLNLVKSINPKYPEGQATLVMTNFINQYAQVKLTPKRGEDKYKFASLSLISDCDKNPKLEQCYLKDTGEYGCYLAYKGKNLTNLTIDTELNKLGVCAANNTLKKCLGGSTKNSKLTPTSKPKPSPTVASGCKISSNICYKSAPKLEKGETYVLKKGAPSSTPNFDFYAFLFSNNPDNVKIGTLKLYFETSEGDTVLGMKTTKGTRYIPLYNKTQLDHCGNSTSLTQLCVR